MFRLDAALLDRLGLGELPAEHKNVMLQHIYETMEGRTGRILAGRMTEEQLDEFEGFISAGDEAGALRWLQTEMPDYKVVVAKCFDDLCGEIRLQADAIVAATPAGSH